MNGFFWIDKLCKTLNIVDRKIMTLAEREQQKLYDKRIWHSICFKLCDGAGVTRPQLNRLLKHAYPAYDRNDPTYFLDRQVEGEFEGKPSLKQGLINFNNMVLSNIRQAKKELKYV